MIDVYDSQSGVDTLPFVNTLSVLFAAVRANTTRSAAMTLAIGCFNTINTTAQWGQRAKGQLSALRDMLLFTPDLTRCLGLQTIFNATALTPLLAEVVVKNKRLQQLSVKTTSKTAQVCDANRLWSLIHDSAWQMAIVSIGWLRANAEHALRYSFLALLPTLTGMALYNHIPDHRAPPKFQTMFNADRWLNTRFCRAEIARHNTFHTSLPVATMRKTGLKRRL